MTFPPLKILHTEAATGLGGQEIYIYRQMLCMRERGHHMALLCQPGARLADLVRSAGLPVYLLKMGGARRLLTGIHAVRQLVRREGFDVVNTTSRIDTLIAATGARLVGTPLVVRSRHLMSPINSRLTYTALPHRVITVSRYVHNMLVDRGIPPARIGVVPPIAALPAWEDANPQACWERLQQSREAVRAELGFDADDVVVGCTAVLREPKGHAELLEAIAPLCHANQRLHLVIVGDGEPVMQRLRARREALGLAAQVHLLGYRSDAARLMSGFDLFALATQKEAAGTVFLEAAQAGLPIVATRVGGVPEMLREGDNALLVARGDQAGLSAALKTLLDDPERRRRMGRAGWEWVRTNPTFSTHGHAEATERLYRQWLQELGPWPAQNPSRS
jgi:glycosyltransferase involved in cell wall biosynthesis